MRISNENEHTRQKYRNHNQKLIQLIELKLTDPRNQIQSLEFCIVIFGIDLHIFSQIVQITPKLVHLSIYSLFVHLLQTSLNTVQIHAIL